MATVRLIFTDDTSNKFWEAETRGKQLHVRWGRIGTAGQSKVYALASPKAAAEEAERQIAEKRRKGYRDAAPTAGATVEKATSEKATVQKAKAKADEARVEKASPKVDALRALAQLLARKDAAGLGDELAQAVSDPAGYFDRFRERLSERGVDGPDDTYATTLPWLALIDGLDARHSLHEVDWKEEIDDVSAKIEKFAKLGKKWWKWSEDEDRFETTTAFLRAAARRLDGEGLVLAYLDMKSDSYPLVVYSKEQRAEVRKLSARCARAGFGKLSFFTGAESHEAEDDEPAPVADDTWAPLPFGGPALVGWAPPFAIFSSEIENESAWADLSVWPPRLSAKLPFWVDSATRGPDGRWLLFAGEWGDSRVERYRVLVAAEPFATRFEELTVPKQKRGLKLTVGGFVRGRVVALSGGTSSIKGSVRLDYSKAPGTDVVHWQDGDQLVPAPGLPPWAELEYMLGFVTLDDGAGVLLWDDKGWELEGGAFVPTFPGPLRWRDSQARAHAVPTQGGFFFVSRHTLATGKGWLREARRGAPQAIEHLRDVDDIASIHAGPDRSLVIKRYGTSALLYFPERREIADVTAAWPSDKIYSVECSGEHFFGVDSGQCRLARVPTAKFLAAPRQKAR